MNAPEDRLASFAIDRVRPADRSTSGVTPKADMPYSRANSSRMPPSPPRASPRSRGSGCRYALEDEEANAAIIASA